MNAKAKRLATFIQELRGSQSQSRLAKQLGVSQGTVNLWESGQSWPATENLGKIAALRGWDLQELLDYLLKGEISERDPLEQILNMMRSLPSEAVAQIAAAAVETLANRSILNQAPRKTIPSTENQEPALSA